MHRNIPALGAIGLAVALLTGCVTDGAPAASAEPAAAAAAAPASAAPAAPAEPAAAPAAPANEQAANAKRFDPDQVVCRIYEVTGTRLPLRNKVCKTRAEWMDEQRAARAAIEGIVERGGMQPGGEQLGTGR